MKKFLLLEQKEWLAAQFAEPLDKNGYGKKNGNKIFALLGKELDLLDNNEVRKWFRIYSPTVVIIAAAKVGGF